MKTIKISIATLGAFGAVAAHAAGFEKATVWSGKHTGVASSAVSSAQGAEALFFNPAGLAGGAGQGDLSLNYSPTFGQYSGPFVEDGDAIKSQRHNSPIFGAVSSYNVSPTIGIGAGVFVSAGSRSDFQDIDYTGAYPGAELEPDAKSELSVLEASVGAGYEVMPGLKIGASWRASFVNAALASPQIKSGFPGASNLLLGLNLVDLKDSNYSSFRAGAQYAGAGWGVGLSMRSKLEFTAEGTTNGKSEFIDGALAAAAGAPQDVTGGNVSIQSQLPLQMELGGHVELPSQLTFFASYNWTDYSQVNQIDLVGSVNLSTSYPGDLSGVAVNLADAPFKTRWKDQHMIKTGLQWDGIENLPLRVGYAYVSQVTPNEYARATFASPGAGSVFTVGAGYQIQEGLNVDGAFEYAKTSGDVSTTEAAAGGIKSGTYSTNAYVVHAGVRYAF